MAEQKIIFEVIEHLKKLDKNEKDKLQKIFLGKTYASFFVFEKNEGVVSALEFLKTFFKDEPMLNHENLFLDVSDNFINESIVDINIGKVFLFPFIRVEHDVFGKYALNSENSQKVLNEFKVVFYRYICVMEIDNKIVFFTDILEDFCEKYFDNLKDIGYKKIELHNVIPRIIDSMNSRFNDGTAEIGELGITFPLSMLGAHAKIRDIFKNKSHIGKDINFTNIIKFGLLDYVKIISDFNISFNSDNDKDKFSLHGFIFPSEAPNIELLKSLKMFLDEISKDIEPGFESNFAGLPIYVISGKKVYDKSYPHFILNEAEESITIDFNTGTSESFNDKNTLRGRFVITGIYPQYLKNRYHDGRNVYCYLTKGENEKEWDMSFNEIIKLFEGNSKLSCEEFLNEMRDKISDYYTYHNEEAAMSSGHGHPNLMSSDLFMTAYSENEDDKSDYLINITNPKTKKQKEQEKLGKKITVDIYKLSSFDFNNKMIEEFINKYNNGESKPYNLGNIIKTPRAPKERGNFSINKLRNIEIHKSCSPAYGTKNNPGKVKHDKYVKPDLYANKQYIDNELTEEDLWSLAIIDLLNKKGHKAFFGGKKSGPQYRELSDIISIHENGDHLNVNLFHIKLKPLEHKKTSNIEASYSYYTQVVGQVLEKFKSFNDISSIDNILSGLKPYFLMKDETRAPNYEIYEELENTLLKNKNKRIHFNIYFSVREQDYFNLDFLKNGNLMDLAYSTNWKRLKIIFDVFKSNISASNPKMKVEFNLCLLVCKNNPSYLDKQIDTSLSLLNLNNIFYSNN